MKKIKFLITISILLVSQAFFYWFIKLFQTNPNYLNFKVDNQIPFIPSFIYIYNIFYPFIFLSFYFIFKNDEETYYIYINIIALQIKINSIVTYIFII